VLGGALDLLRARGALDQARTVVLEMRRAADEGRLRGWSAMARVMHAELLLAEGAREEAASLADEALPALIGDRYEGWARGVRAAALDDLEEARREAARAAELLVDRPYDRALVLAVAADVEHRAGDADAEAARREQARAQAARIDPDGVRVLDHALWAGRQ
jgi:hypothetical protein